MRKLTNNEMLTGSIFLYGDIVEGYEYTLNAIVEYLMTDHPYDPAIKNRAKAIKIAKKEINNYVTGRLARNIIKAECESADHFLLRGGIKWIT